MRPILIVEDSENDRRLLKRALQAAGVRNAIHQASTGKQALKWLGQTVAAARKELAPAVAIVFVDLKLPDMTGFEILARIKEEPDLQQMLRIVLSQMEDLASIRRAYSLGAQSFLTKPPTQDDLRELIKGFPDHWLLSAAVGRSSARQLPKYRKIVADRQPEVRETVRPIDHSQDVNEPLSGPQA